MKTKVFQDKLEKYSLLLGNIQRRHIMIFLFEDGNISVVKGINSFQPSVNEVLHFVTKLNHIGLGYSAINTARLALSSYGIQNFVVHWLFDF